MTLGIIIKPQVNIFQEQGHQCVVHIFTSRLGDRLNQGESGTLWLKRKRFLCQSSNPSKCAEPACSSKCMSRLSGTIDHCGHGIVSYYLNFTFLKIHNIIFDLLKYSNSAGWETAKFHEGYAEMVMLKPLCDLTLEFLVAILT